MQDCLSLAQSQATSITEIRSGSACLSDAQVQDEQEG